MTPELAVEALSSQQSATLAKPFHAFAGHGFSFNDIARFEASMSEQTSLRASATQQISSTHLYDKAGFLNSQSLQAFLTPFDKISSSSQNIMGNSELLAASPDASPGDLLMTMVSIQKFMFECQMTSSVANRTSDGIQELFRQQS
jgi:hypothetical protein